MRIKSILAIILIALMSGIIAADEKRAMTLDDLYGYKRVGAPVVSPDGKTIAFTITEADVAANRNHTEIYLMPVEGGEPYQLTSDDSSSYGAVWSPDGKQLAFGRRGQLWIINIAGGEAKQITHIPSGAGGFKWMPDGKNLLFTSFVWANCDEDCAAEREAKEKKSKVTAKVAENLLFRHWNTWRTDGKHSHLFMVNAETGEYKDLIPDAEYDVPPFPFGSEADYDISPDGKEICFAAKLEGNKAIHTNLDLQLLNLETGEVKTITTEFKGEDKNPVYSPCGKYIAFLARLRAGFEADQNEIIIYNREDGSFKNITENFDRNINEMIWNPKDHGFYVVVDHHGEYPIFTLDMEGNGELFVGDGSLFSVSLTDENLVYSYRSLVNPPTIYATNLETKETKDLTPFVIDYFKDIEFGTVENYWFDGAKGDKVQVWIVKPPFFEEGKKYPLFQLIHGGPQQNYANIWTTGWSSQAFAARGFVVALVCFHGTPGYGQEFTDGVTKDWGGAPYEDIMKATDYLISLGFVDEDKMAAGGGSYGGYMTNWIATHTDRFKALISHAGLWNLESMYGATEELWFPEWELGGVYWENDELYEKWSPHNYAENLGTPTLVIHGQQDFRVPVSQGLEFFTVLQRQGVPSKFIYYPDECHWIMQLQNKYFWYEEFFAWLDKWVLNK